MNIEKAAAKTVVTSRTKFQLRFFVVGQHDTKPMQWRQLLIEAQDLAYKIRTAELGLERTSIEITNLLHTGDPLDLIDAKQKELDRVLTERVLEGAKLEFSWLEEFAEEIGAYSNQEIEDDQETYWSKRLQRQSDIDVLSRTQGISVGNLTSMLNAGLLAYEQEASCAISPGN